MICKDIVNNTIEFDPFVRAARERESLTMPEYERYVRPMMQEPEHVRVLDDKQKKLVRATFAELRRRGSQEVERLERAWA